MTFILKKKECLVSGYGNRKQVNVLSSVKCENINECVSKSMVKISQYNFTKFLKILSTKIFNGKFPWLTLLK